MFQTCEKKIVHFGFKLVGINYQFCIDLVTLHENLCDGEKWNFFFIYTGFRYIENLIFRIFFFVKELNWI